jgi:hypothetical protein
LILYFIIWVEFAFFITKKQKIENLKKKIQLNDECTFKCHKITSPFWSRSPHLVCIFSMKKCTRNPHLVCIFFRKKKAQPPSIACFPRKHAWRWPQQARIFSMKK